MIHAHVAQVKNTGSVVEGNNTMNNSITEYIKALDEDILREIVLELSEHYNAYNAQTFHEYIMKKASDSLDKNDFKNLAKKHLTKGVIDLKLVEFDSFLQDVQANTKYLNYVYDEDYEYGWDDEDEEAYYYVDDFGIFSFFNSLNGLIEECLRAGYYKEAYHICSSLLSVSVYVEGEYAYEKALDLERLSRLSEINLDYNYICLCTLYSCYQSHNANECVSLFYDLYMTYPWFKYINLEQIVTFGYETLEDIEVFFIEWLAFLKTQTGELASKLYIEAILYHEGKEGLIKRAYDDCQKHPRLFIAAIEQVHTNEEIVKLVKDGLELVEDIEIINQLGKYGVGSAIALKDDSLATYCAYRSFMVKPEISTLLVIYKDKELAKEYHNECKEKLILEQETIHHFFNGDFDYLYNKDHISIYIAELLFAYIAPNILEATNIKLSKLTNSYLLNEEDYRHCFRNWCSFYKYDNSKIMECCEKALDNYIEWTFENKNRDSYANVAHELYVYANVRKQLGERNAIQEVYEKYHSEYRRFRAFIPELQHVFNRI